MKKLYSYCYDFCALFFLGTVLCSFPVKTVLGMPSAVSQQEQQSAPPVLPQFAHLAKMAREQKNAATQIQNMPESQDSDEQSSEQPMPVQEQAPGAENVQLSEESIGIQGNWIKKNEWLSKTYELRNEIQNERARIQSIRQIFSEKYSEIDKELDNFYNTMGLEQGKLNELFNGVTKFLNKKKQKLIAQANQEQKDDANKDRDYKIKIDTIEEQISKLRTQFDQLQYDMKSIVDLDDSLTKRLEKADEQIKQAETESEKIRDVTEQQWKVIDHNIARENYYKFRGNTLEKLKTIANYLENDLLKDFDNVTQIIRTQFDKVKAGTEALEKEGIIIKDRSTRIEKLKLEEIRQTETEQERLLSEQQNKQEKTQNLTWYQKIYDAFTSLLARILAPIKSVYDSLFGAPKAQAHTPTPPAQTPTAPVATPPTMPVQPAQPVMGTMPTTQVPAQMPQTPPVSTEMPSSSMQQVPQDILADVPATGMPRA